MAYKIITIGDKEVPMLALASCDNYYKKVFHEDPLGIMSRKDDDDGAKSRVAFNMGFIFAKFAEYKDRKKMLQLNEEDFIEWLEQFEYGDYVQAAAEVLDLYYFQKKTTATEKNVKGL